MKIDLVSYPARVEGLVNMITHIFPRYRQHLSAKPAGAEEYTG